MQSIPNEILITIFSLCIDGCGAVLDPDTHRVLPLDPLSEVCSEWRSIIRGTSELWAALSVDFGVMMDVQRLVNTALWCLSRSGDLIPISLSLFAANSSAWFDLVDYEPHPIRFLVTTFAHRFSHLELSLPYEWLVEFLRLPPHRMGVLKSARIEFLYHGETMSDSEDALPVLTSEPIRTFARSLNLRSLTMTLRPRTHTDQLTGRPIQLKLLPGAERGIPWPQLTHLNLIGLNVPYHILHNRILQHCPSLVSLAITTSTVNSEAVEQTILLNLKSLTLDIQSTEWLYLAPCKFFVLERLILQGETEDNFWPDFVSALITDLPVTSISISLPVENGRIERLLRSAPSLIELEATEDCCISGAILQEMTTRTLVPGLERLKCRLRTVYLDKFIDMLESRWTLTATEASHPAIHMAEISCFTDESDQHHFKSGDIDRMVAGAKARLRDLGAKARGIKIAF